MTDYPAVTTDYLPTILELTGQKMPDDRALDGISLVPLLQGKTMERKQPIYFQTRGGLKSKTSRGSPAHALTESRYKLLTDFDSNGTSDRLYDLVKDPGETINLAAQEPARVKRMKNQLRAWKDQCQESNLDSE